MVHFSNVKELHSLTLRLNPHGIALVDYSPFEKRMPRYEWMEADRNTSFASSLRRILEASQLASGTYRHVEVLVESPYTLLPISDFREEEKEDVFHFNFPGQHDVAVHYDIIPSLGAALVYGCDALTEQMLAERYEERHVTHYATHLIGHFLSRNRHHTETQLFGYLHDEWIDVVLFRKNQLLLANRFRVETNEDATYFVLLAFKQLNLSNETDEIFIIGNERERQDQLIERLKDFVPNAYPINPCGEFNRHPLTSIKGMPYDLLLFMLRQY